MVKLSLLVAMIALGCASSEATETSQLAPAGPPLCRSGTAHADPCRDPQDVERWLEDPELEITASAKTPGGLQRARVLTVTLPGETTFRAKWRAGSTETKRNSPRRELAAYELQKLFLDPEDYVVPPAAYHCFPLDSYRAHVDEKAAPSLPGVVCGVLSYWIEDVEPLSRARSEGWFHGKSGHAFDPKMFLALPSYRQSVADANVFAYLIAHADSHPANFMITSDRAAPWVYSVDNSLSLGLHKNRGLAPRHDWSRIRVPAVRRATIDRLREFTTGDALLITDLSQEESDDVRERIRALVARVDAGELAVF